jgi:hypothetical protein
VTRGAGLGDGVEVVFAEVLVDGPIGEDAVGDAENLVGDRESGSLGTSARLEAIEFGT